MEEIYILDGARTPFGSFGQSLKDEGVTELGAITALEAMKRSRVDPNEVDHVIYGNVIHSSVNYAYVPRHIALRSGIPIETPAYAVNRVCGSGMQATLNGAQSIALGEARVVLVGGVENVSQTPHANFISRFAGGKFGHLELQDMLLHALMDHHTGCGMGMTAENLAMQYSISRTEQDEFALLSHQRAVQAEQRLAEEIVNVTVKRRKDTLTVGRDEQVRADSTMEKLSRLPPAFVSDGTVTAGNASSINDGAVSIVLAGALSLGGKKPLARIVSWAVSGVDPRIMGIGPVPAIRLALKRAGLSLEDMDRIEVNEAFAAQALAVEKELGLDQSKLNVNGGAIAIGHPIGASGARLVLTLAHELKRTGLRYGVASLCIGGGQGIAMVIENKNF